MSVLFLWRIIILSNPLLISFSSALEFIDLKSSKHALDNHDEKRTSKMIQQENIECTLTNYVVCTFAKKKVVTKSSIPENLLYTAVTHYRPIFDGTVQSRFSDTFGLCKICH